MAPFGRYPGGPGCPPHSEAVVWADRDARRKRRAQARPVRGIVQLDRISNWISSEEEYFYRDY